MGGITARIAATILVILILAGALRTVLNVSKFDDAFTGLLQSRLSVIVLDVQQTVESSLSLGLPLNALVNAQEMLDRERLQDDGILSILIHDRQGRRLFDSETARVGQEIPQGWPVVQSVAPSSEGEQTWVLREADAFTVGAPLRNNLGEVVGGIALRYDRSRYDAAFETIFDKLAAYTLAMLAAGAVVTYLGVMVLFRPMRRRLRQLETALRGTGTGVDGSGADSGLLTDHVAPLHRAIAEADGEIARVARLLESARSSGAGQPT